jgi:hypothetical protein
MKRMNQTNLLLAFGAAALLTAGCNNQPAEPAGGTNSVATNASLTASNTWQTTKQDASNVWTATKDAATNAWQSTAEAGSNAWHATKETFGAATNEISTNYFACDYSQKDAFVAGAQTDLNALDQKTSTLAGKIAGASDSAKADLQQKLQDINNRRADLGKRYDDVKNATAANWDDAKAAFVKAYFDFRATLKAGQDSLAANM